MDNYIKELEGQERKEARMTSATGCGFQPPWQQISHFGETRMPYPLVLQDQRVQNISTADAAPPPETEFSTIIEHVVKLVPDHQTTTACAIHRPPPQSGRIRPLQSLFRRALGLFYTQRDTPGQMVQLSVEPPATHHNAHSPSLSN